MSRSCGEHRVQSWTWRLTICRPGLRPGTNQLVGQCRHSTPSGVPRGVPGTRLLSKSLRWEVLMDPNPDYDASDEIEYFFNWFPWALRGVYPPPAYPPV